MPIAFSTNPDVRRTPDRRANPSAIVDLPNERMSALFEAAVEAAEEAAINSMFAATPDGRQRPPRRRAAGGRGREAVQADPALISASAPSAEFRCR